MISKKIIVLLMGSFIAALIILKLFLTFDDKNTLFKNNFLLGNKMEKTFAIIKPDAVKAKNTGKIIDRIEQEGFEILEMKKIHLSKEQAEKFYEIHKEKPFFPSLIEFMTSGPVVVMILQKENAIKTWRDLMGETDPSQAEKNTLRKLYGTNKGENALHGSDAPETAAIEIKFFFPELLS